MKKETKSKNQKSTTRLIQCTKPTYRRLTIDEKQYTRTSQLVSNTSDNSCRPETVIQKQTFRIHSHTNVAQLLCRHLIQNWKNFPLLSSRRGCKAQKSPAYIGLGSHVVGGGGRGHVVSHVVVKIAILRDWCRSGLKIFDPNFLTYFTVKTLPNGK